MEILIWFDFRSNSKLHRFSLPCDNLIHTHPDSSHQLHRSHTMQYCCGYWKLEYLWGYSDATVIGANAHAVAVEYPHSSFNGTPTHSSHTGTVLYETYVAGQEESGCVCITILTGHSSSVGVPRVWNILPSWSKSDSPGRNGALSNSSANMQPVAHMSTPVP